MKYCTDPEQEFGGVWKGALKHGWEPDLEIEQVSDHFQHWYQPKYTSR